MPQITDIKPQKSSKGRLASGQRFNIFVDEKFAFGLDADTLVKSGLKINQEISQQEIDKLIKENEFGKVYERVLKIFSYRPRSEKELHDWFVRKQIGEEIQKMILRKLKNFGYLNDEEFAKWWIEQRVTFKPAGKRLLTMELRQKGVSRELIAKLLDCYIDKDQERGLAQKVVEKKLKAWQNLSKEELKKKLAGVLARRGFNWETIKEVVSGVDEILKKE